MAFPKELYGSDDDLGTLSPLSPGQHLDLERPEPRSALERAAELGQGALQVAGGVLNVAGAGAGVLAGLGTGVVDAALGRQAPDELPTAYMRALGENLGDRPIDDIGFFDALRAAPGAGQVVAESLAPGRPSSAPGRIAKRVGGLAGDIVTDPANLVLGPGVKAAARASQLAARAAAAGRGGRAARLAGIAAKETLGSPVAGVVYGPEIARGYYEGVRAAAERAGEGDLPGAIEAGVEAAALTGLGGLMARGAQRELTRPAAQPRPMYGEGAREAWDVEFPQEPTALEQAAAGGAETPGSLAARTVRDLEDWRIQSIREGQTPDPQAMAMAEQARLGRGRLRASRQARLEEDARELQRPNLEAAAAAETARLARTQLPQFTDAALGRDVVAAGEAFLAAEAAAQRRRGLDVELEQLDQTPLPSERQALDEAAREQLLQASEEAQRQTSLERQARRDVTPDREAAVNTEMVRMLREYKTARSEEKASRKAALQEWVDRMRPQIAEAIMRRVRLEVPGIEAPKGPIELAQPQIGERRRPRAEDFEDLDQPTSDAEVDLALQGIARQLTQAERPGIVKGRNPLTGEVTSLSRPSVKPELGLGDVAGDRGDLVRAIEKGEGPLFEDVRKAVRADIDERKDRARAERDRGLEAAARDRTERAAIQGERAAPEEAMEFEPAEFEVPGLRETEVSRLEERAAEERPPAQPGQERPELDLTPTKTPTSRKERPRPAGAVVERIRTPDGRRTEEQLVVPGALELGAAQPVRPTEDLGELPLFTQGEDARARAEAEKAESAQATLPMPRTALEAAVEATQLGGPADVAGQAAATAPGKPQPSEAQLEAGNYKLGHARIIGLDVSIENPRGSVRSGTDASGKPWSVTMKSAYGYFRGTEGKDKEHIDAYIKPGTPADWNGPVHVVNQNKGNGQFDEHKVMLGWQTEAEARAGYLENYSAGWKGLGSIATFRDADAFRDWLEKGDTTKPAPVERRQDLARRRRAAEMSEEEKGRALLTDELTGIGNKRAWQEAAEGLGDRGVVAMDLAGFKALNDRIGHENADQVLKAVGEALGRIVGRDNAFRPHGDEFIAVAPTDRLEAVERQIVEQLAGLRVEVDLGDGRAETVQGVRAHVGRGASYRDADVDLNRRAAEERRGGRSAEDEARPEPTPVPPPRAAGRQDQEHQARAGGELATEPAARPAPTRRTPEDAAAIDARILREARKKEKAPPPPEEGAAPRTFWKGDEAEYTGTERKLGTGGKFYELRLLQGHRKGQTVWTQRGPGEPEPVPVKPTAGFAKAAAELEGELTGRRPKAQAEPGFRAPEATEERRAADIGMTTEEYRRAGGGDRLPALVDHFTKALERGDLPKDPRALRAYAQEVLGETKAADAIDDIYDSLEAATNRYHRSEATPAPLDLAIQAAAAREGRLANRIRSLEITERQQFSTPFPLATAAARAADVRAQDLVEEPTAGTGNLLEPLQGPNAPRMKAVEIDPRRAELLRLNGYDVDEADYLRWKPDEAPDVIVTNPPWGKVGTGRYTKLDAPPPWGGVGAKYGDVAERFVVKNLSELQAGGRLVAVMPTTVLGKDGAGFRQWLKANHTTRAWIQSPPGAYKTRGTTVDSVLLVVDKGKTVNAPDALVRMGNSTPRDWKAYAEALKPLVEGGTHARVSRPQAARPAPAEGRAAPADRGAAAPEGPVAARPGAPARGRVPGAELRGGPVLRPGEPRPPAPVVPEEGPGGQPPDAEGESAGVRGGAGAVRKLRERVAALRKSHEKEADDSPVFAPYVPRHRAGTGPTPEHAHPRLVVETRSLAGAPYPALTYHPSRQVLDARDRGVMSDEQIDIVAAIGQAVEKGHGFLAADDVGLGKSREIGGTILDWFDKKHANRILVTTKGENNVHDLVREWKLVAGVGEDGELPFRVVPVGTFKESAERGGRKDLKPLPEFDKAVYVVTSFEIASFHKTLLDVGLDGLIGDEVHTYKNVPGAEAGGKGVPAVGRAWKALSKQLVDGKRPMAYFTATPGQGIYDLEYLYGLREWSLDGFEDWVGLKTGSITEEQLRKRAELDAKQAAAAAAAEPDIKAEAGADEAQQGLVETRDRRTGKRKSDVFAARVPAGELEQVMRELKMAGKFSARDLWRGGVEFAEAERPLSSPEKARYEKAVLYLRELEEAYDKFAPYNQTKKGFGPAAWLQAAAKRLLFDFRIDRAIDQAKAALERGEQPVISVINVNEVIGDEGNVGAIIRQINTKNIEFDDDTGESIDHGDIPEAVARVAELRERAREAYGDLPNPVEKVYAAFGGKDQVAAIIGEVTPKQRRRIMQDFQEGIRKVALISGAGKTGISLHHVKELLDAGPGKGRRHMILADYEWSAEVFKQELGRVDRSDQVSSPKISATTIGSSAEKKFLATIALRMKTLGAVSKGAAESTGTSSLLEAFELGGGLDNYLVRDLWRQLNPDEKGWFRGAKFREPAGTDGVSHPRHEIAAGVRDFLMQMQLMPVDVGNTLFDKYMQLREASAPHRETMARVKEVGTSGEITRSTRLTDDLQLYETKNEAGNRGGLLVGVITPKYPLVKQALSGAVAFDNKHYYTFRAKDGRQISGLWVPPGRIPVLAKMFSVHMAVKRTPETAMEDLGAGDKLDLANGWQLYLGKGGDRANKIVITGEGLMKATERGATIARATGLTPTQHFSPVGNYFYLPVKDEILQKFLARFPLKVEASDAAKAAAGVSEGPALTALRAAAGVSDVAAAALERLKKGPKDANELVRAAAAGGAAWRDVVIVGADAIARGMTSFRQWSGHMVSELGEWVRRALRRVFGASRAEAARAGARPRAVAAPAAPPSVPPPGSSRGRPGPQRLVAKTREANRVTSLTAPRTGRVEEAAPILEAARGEGGIARGKPPELPFNLDRMNVPVEAKQRFQRIVESMQDDVDRAQGYVSWDTLDEQTARLMGITSAKDFEAMARAGFQFNSTMVDASRKFLQEERTKLDDVVARYEASRGTEREEDAFRRATEESLSFANLVLALKGEQSEAARALAARRRMAEERTPGERLLGQLFREMGGVSTEDAARIVRQAMLDPAQLADAVRAALHPGKLKKFVELWKAGLLSGPQTHGANWIGNSLKQAMTLTETGLAGLIDPAVAKLQGRQRGLDGKSDRYKEEVGVALAAVKSVTPSALAKLRQDLKALALLRPEELDLDAPGQLEYHVGAISGKKGRAVRIPFRLLQAADNFWKSLAGEQELYKQAYRRARGDGLRGDEARARMASIIEAVRDVDNPRFDDIRSAVKAARDRETFQTRLSGDTPLGMVGALLQRLVHRYQAFGFITPFIRTPANIAHATLEHLPTHFIKIVRDVRAGKLAGGKLSEELAKPILGTLIGGMFVALAQEGLVTGGGPVDNREKNLLRDTGWQPYSVRVAGQYFGYNRFDPITDVLAIAADVAEAKDQKTAGDIFQKLVGSAMDNLFSATYLSGLENLHQLLSEPRRYASTFAKQQMGSLVPNIVAKLALAIDPVVRETQATELGPFGIPEPIAARLPGVSRMLPARRTATGEQVSRPGSAVERFGSPVPRSTARSDRGLEAELVRLGYVPQISRDATVPNTGGLKTRYTDSEMAMFAEADRAAATKLRRIIRDPRWARIAEDRRGRGSKVGIIQRVYDQERDRVRARLGAVLRRRVAAERRQRA